MYVCMYVCLYVCVMSSGLIHSMLGWFLFSCFDVPVCELDWSMCGSVCMYACMYVLCPLAWYSGLGENVCMYVYMYVCIYVCIYIYVCVVSSCLVFWLSTSYAVGMCISCFSVSISEFEWSMHDNYALRVYVWVLTQCLICIRIVHFVL
jgi:hypothetical protein